MNDEVLYRTTQSANRNTGFVLMHLYDVDAVGFHVGIYNTKEEALEAAVSEVRHQLIDDRDTGWFSEEEIDEHLAVLDQKTVGGVAEAMEMSLCIKENVEVGQKVEIQF